jgi:hypothetical protein
MNSAQQLFGTSIPDLRDIPLERLERAAELGDSVLAHSLALYGKRLGEKAGLGCAFNSSILVSLDRHQSPCAGRGRHGNRGG